MTQRRRTMRLAAGAAAVAALIGCAETQFVATAVKKAQGTSEPRSNGVYKVGQPYRIGGVDYVPVEDYGYSETGIASFYGGEASGVDFHGRFTANGEVYDMNALTAAHQTLPMPSLVRVTNLENGRQLVLRVNDRGPFVQGRILDVSRRSSQLLGFERQGTARVRVEILPGESKALKESMLRGAAPPIDTRPQAQTASVGEARAPVASDALPPPPGGRAGASVASQPLPPPSATLAQTQQTQQPRRQGGTQPLARPAPPVHTEPAAAPASATIREVAALPPERQARATPTLNQIAVQPSTIWVQAGAFSNYDNAYRLSARLSRYGKTQVAPVSNGGQQLYRVRVGPVQSVPEADRLLAQVAEVTPEARIVVAE